MRGKPIPIRPDGNPQTWEPELDLRPVVEPEPAVVAETVFKAAKAAQPKLRYAVGGRASRLRWLRRFAPAGLVDAGIRRNLRLDELTASRPRSAVLVKS